MLPFHHVHGYTLFPVAQQAGSRWVGIVRIFGGRAAVHMQPSAEDFDSEQAAHLAAVIEAATIANAFRAVG